LGKAVEKPCQKVGCNTGAAGIKWQKRVVNQWGREQEPWCPRGILPNAITSRGQSPSTNQQGSWGSAVQFRWSSGCGVVKIK